MVLNSVMVGFLAAVTRLLEPEAVRKAVADSVPSNFCDLNLKAFEKGYEYEMKSLVDNPHSQELEHVSYAEE
jgi:2-oxoglutarate ferredoxin oxidoreductase subunit gamma